MVVINPHGVKTFNKNIFLNTPVQTLLFHVFQGWNQKEFQCRGTQIAPNKDNNNQKYLQ